MVDFLFYFFSAVLLASAVMVVAGREPVTAAMFLLVSMASAAAMFFLLEAFFLGILQVLVYAGAVVVLFLFIIMLLDPESGRRKIGRGTLVTSFVALLVLFAGVFYFFTADRIIAPGTLATTEAVGAASKDYGYYLFSVYLLPFLTAGFLLLTAMLGVILIGKRDPSSGDGRA